MYKLAKKTLLLDLIRLIKSRGLIAVLIMIVLAWFYIIYDSGSTIVIALMYMWGLVLLKFTPESKKIYYVLPVSDADIKKLIIYRTLIFEMIMIICGIVLSIILYMVADMEAFRRGIVISGFVFGVYVTISVVEFIHHINELSSKKQKTMAILISAALAGLSISAALEREAIFAVGISPFLILAASIIMLLSISWYCICFSNYKVYKEYNTNQRGKGQKFEEREWG